MALCVLMAGCAEATPPAAWVRECPREAFCFTRPADLLAQPVQAIDSLALSYRNPKLSLVVDMGRYGTSTAHLVAATETSLTVSGRPARLLSTEREWVLVVPKVYDTDAINVQFSMTLRFEGKASAELAQRIFQSIEFKPRR